jgi:RIO-like serine/threonine protein kinase
MKLNVKNIRYLTADDWRVLTAVCARITSFCS